MDSDTEYTRIPTPELDAVNHSINSSPLRRPIIIRKPSIRKPPSAQTSSPESLADISERRTRELRAAAKEKEYERERDMIQQITPHTPSRTRQHDRNDSRTQRKERQHHTIDMRYMRNIPDARHETHPTHTTDMRFAGDGYGYDNNDDICPKTGNNACTDSFIVMICIMAAMNAGTVIINLLFYGSKGISSDGSFIECKSLPFFLGVIFLMITDVSVINSLKCMQVRATVICQMLSRLALCVILFALYYQAVVQAWDHANDGGWLGLLFRCDMVYNGIVAAAYLINVCLLCRECV